MYFIYKLTWGENACRYVGCTTNPNGRRIGHANSKVPKVAAANRAHGRAAMTILEVVEGSDVAAQREKWHIENECAHIEWMGGCNSAATITYSHVEREIQDVSDETQAPPVAASPEQKEHRRILARALVENGVRNNPSGGGNVFALDLAAAQAQLERRRALARQLVASSLAKIE